ncbi:MAG: UDP-N-acetylmuramoyl-L-alanine--D-glutamate ligase [Gemmatimonadetes bacterium]|nr:UDP-N-acetylmuramoyl-L-alanine--D-glutamate ligase [Gemmatimonadota bacterium]
MSRSRLPIDGKRVCVVGAARSGLAAARVLAALGAVPFMTDQAESATAELEASGFEFELGGHSAASLRGVELVVVSPGVPWKAPFIRSARERGIPVIGEIELAYRLTDATFIAITGSNGKSTTTALTAHLLDALSFDARACGNIGLPVCDLAIDAPSSRILVAEVSSFQLESVMGFRPRVAAVLNLTPDHLERHGGFEGYVEAKTAIFRRAGPGDHVILSAGDPRTRALSRRVPPGVRIRFFGAEFPALPCIDALELPGGHNRANALAALAIVRAIAPDASNDALADALASFRSLPHRLERLAELGSVLYINDSKATNVDSACVALRSYPRGVIWIAGGRDKGADLTPLTQAAKGRVRQALLIGEASARMASALAEEVAVEEVGTLDRALARAREMAHPGDVVLLSPACSSYDQFSDFERRGDAMRSLVTAFGSAS